MMAIKKAVLKDITVDQLRRYSISTGAVFSDEYLLAAMTNDARVDRDAEDLHSYMGIFRGVSWQIIEMGYPLRSQAVVEKPARCIISLTAMGQVRRSTPTGGEDEAKVGDASGLRVVERTRLVEVRNIGGIAYTVGTRRSCYRRVDTGVWDCLDAECYTAEDSSAGFMSVHGFPQKEVYAVGLRGEIWEFDGKHWIQRESGTNVDLHKVLCAADKFVYAAGMDGTILKGRHDSWAPLSDVDAGYEFWGIQDFKGKIYFTANARLVLELRKQGGLKLVDFGECPIPSTAYHLTLGADALYSFGAKNVVKFDGTEWEEVLSLD